MIVITVVMTTEALHRVLGMLDAPASFRAAADALI